MTPACRTCAHSIARPSMLRGGAVLWCARWQTLAAKPCAEYLREPGSDDE